tara:strand:+ start:1182 stop:3944 length:2763 start_codon:yes stop_codon:yes gene_type:complete
MPLKVYKRLGLRRDNNLSDMSSTTDGLNNLLNTLIDEVNTSFIYSDLNAIRNIFTRGLTSEGYQKIIGSATQFSTTNGINVAFRPRITYQNRLDQFKIFTGVPRFNGGGGLTAKYFQKDQIIPVVDADFVYNQSNGDPIDTNNNDSSIFLGTTSLGEIPDDTFWEAGNFDYSGKIHPRSVFTDGGVKWEGYFIPTETGVHTFYPDSTGYYTMDFEKQGYIVGAGDTYVASARVGLTTVITGSCDPTANDNVVTITANRVRTVGVGMSVQGNGIQSGEVSGVIRWPIVESMDQSGGVITLTPVDGQTASISSAQTNQDYTFFRNLGEGVSTTFSTHVLTAFRKYRIRLRYFFPRNIDSRDYDRRFGIDYSAPVHSSGVHLRRENLYSLDYDFSDSAKGDFNDYFDTSVLFGGSSQMGIGSTTLADNYVKVKSTKKVDITYRAKDSISAIKRVPAGKQASVTSGSPIMNMQGIPVTTTGIEIGNYVVGDNIPNNTRVTEIAINRFVVLDKLATGTGSSTYDFINHRGYVKRILTKNSNGSVITPRMGMTVTYDNLHPDTAAGGTAYGNKPNATTMNFYDGDGTDTNASLTIQTGSSTADNPRWSEDGYGLLADGPGTVSIRYVYNDNDSISGNHFDNCYVDGVNVADYNVDGDDDDDDDGDTTTVINYPLSKVTHASQSTVSGDGTLGIGSIMKNQIAIGDNLSSYTRITDVTPPANADDPGSITVDPAPTSTLGEQSVYIYESKGLIDKSLQAYCVDGQRKCLITVANASTGDQTIFVAEGTASSLNTNWGLQGFNFATSTNISGVIVTSGQPDRIDFSPGLTSNMNSGSQFTATTHADDRQLCCPPTDTSPPFSATEEGLNTLPAFPHLYIANGNIKFDELYAEFGSGASITNYNASSDDVTTKIDIGTPSGTFKILAST